MSSRRTLPGAILEGGARLVSRAARAVLRDPRGQEALARAVGMAQRGRRRLEEVQEQVMAAAGIPGRKDYEELARQLGRIKRKARALGARMDGAPQPPDAGEPREDVDLVDTPPPGRHTPPPR
jgi:hypothetical protein